MTVFIKLHPGWCKGLQHASISRPLTSHMTQRHRKSNSNIHQGVYTLVTSNAWIKRRKGVNYLLVQTLCFHELCI